MGAASLLDAKISIAERWGIPVRSQRLLCGEAEFDDETQVFTLGEHDITLTVVSVQVRGFQNGNHVIAVQDSKYNSWRRAGAEGVVRNVHEDGSLDVFWYTPQT